MLRIDDILRICVVADDLSARDSELLAATLSSAPLVYDVTMIVEEESNPLAEA